MCRSYPVWVDINSCQYSQSTGKSGNKSYGIKADGVQEIKIGTSASNSHHFAKIEIKVRDIEGGKIFKLYVDGIKIKEATVKDKEIEITLNRLRELASVLQ